MSARIETPAAREILKRSIGILHGETKLLVGLGFSVRADTILTCQSVVREALAKRGTEVAIKEGDSVWVTDAERNPVEARIAAIGREPLLPSSELVLLRITLPSLPRHYGLPECASTLRYEGRGVALLGRLGDQREPTLIYGKISGTAGTDLLALQDLDGEHFGGSPVWCDELAAFIGIAFALPSSPHASRVVCLTAPALCSIYPELPVRFQIPDAERLAIRDFKTDDPNVEFFGTEAEKNGRKLSATIEKDERGRPVVKMKYEIEMGAPMARGRFVTFITYPDMKDYQIFEEIGDTRKVDAKCYPAFPDFTIAAIGDGGDTRLTFDLAKLPQPPLPSSILNEPLGPPDDFGKMAPPTPPPNAPFAPKPTPIATPEYTQGPTGFNSEYCAVGRKAEIQDQLKVEDFAKRLAELMVLRETRLPLAMGLFGNWGSGKSYFMNLLDQHMQSKAKEAREDWEKRKKDWEKQEKEKQKKEAGGKESGEKPPDKGPWCHQMVPVYFNAWHYVDTNLWASLVAHIFESLFFHLKPKPNELKKVQEMLEQASGTAARATEELAMAKEEAGKAQLELAAAKAAHEQQQTFVRGLLDSLKALLPDAGKEKDRQKAARTLGAEKALETFEELHEVVAEAQTTAGRALTFWNSFWGQGWAWRIGWLLVAIGAIFLGPRLVAYWKLTGGAEVLAKCAAYLTPWLSLAGIALAKANSALKTMEEWEAKALEAQEQKRRNDPVVKGAEQKAHAADARVQAAQSRLAEAEAKQKQLQEEAANLAPERRIARFIEQRAQSSDYKGQLGLVSLARRDFEELSNLFANTDALKEMDEELRKKEKEAEAKRVKAEEAAATAERVQREAEKKAAEETNETTAAAAKADAARKGKIAAAARTGAARKKKAAAAAKAEQKRLQEASDSIDRIVLFVDDLDRCQTDKVVDVLQAVHLLLAFPLFAVVVGVDQRCLRQSLQKQFKGLLTPSEKNGKVKRSPLVEMDAERPATPLDYLEKIFHIPFHLPPMEKEGFEALITNLTEPRKERASDQSNAQEQPAAKPPAPASPPVPAAEGNKVVDAAKPAVSPAPVQTASSAPAGSPGDPGKTAAPAQTEKTAPVVEKKRVGSTPLHDWERNALKEYYALIATPRGATRLLNTYRLMRAGIPKDEWGLFCGDQKTTGEFRVAMLLLAVSAGRPSVARNWFGRMRRMRVARLDDLAEPNESEVGSLKEWEDFVKDFDLAVQRLQPQPEPARFETWFRRVERFTF